MYGGFCKDQVETAIIRRLRKPIQQLKGISQTDRDCLPLNGGQGSIEIPTPSTETLPGTAESYTRNAKQRRSELGDRHNFRPSRLEKPESSPYQFSGVSKANKRQFVKFGDDPGHQNAAFRRKRVLQQQFGADLIILGCVKNNTQGSLIEVGLQNPELDLPRDGGDIGRRQTTAAFAEDLAQIFLVVRHALELWREGV